MINPRNNGRYTKLGRVVYIRKFNLFDNIFIERWICRLTTVSNFNISINLRWACEIIIEKTRRYFYRIFNANMNKARRSYHSISIFFNKVIMLKVWANRRNKNILSSYFSLCSRRESLNQLLYIVQSTFYNRRCINIINNMSPLYWTRRRRVNFRKLFNLHFKAL